jgi:glycosyltransferase 2 family protein
LKNRGVLKHLIPGLLIAAAALYLTYRKTDLDQLLNTLSGMHWPILALVLPPLFLSYVFRVARWRKLLLPQRRVSAAEATGPLITGFFVNTLLPGRVGEVLRALLLSRRTGVSRAGSFATVVLARIFDGLTLAALTLLILTMLWGRLQPATRMGLIAAGLMYVLVLAALVSLRKYRERAARVISAPLRWTGMTSFSKKFERVLLSFAKGLDILKNWRDILKISLYSLLVWTSLVMSVIPVFWAMDLQMMWYYPVLVIVLAGLGMLIPTPAGTGTIHGALVLVLPGLVGITVANTRILALLFHTTQFMPVIVVGLVFAIREGVTASQVSSIAEHEQEIILLEEDKSEDG